MKNEKFQIFIGIIFIIIINLISKISCDINIHVIPHSHMDPGWLKTPEQYYDSEAIEGIFDTIVKELSENSKKTFVINEIYYFKIWYTSTSYEQKEKFKKLLQEKRIEFVSGSYIINDEANPLYYNIIDQIRIGNQFLLEEFGILPKTGWYIDSFGHSAGNAHILSQMNFDNLVLGRMHTDFLELMQKKQKTEFYWDPFGNNSNKKILTHVLPLHYGFELYLLTLGLEHEEFIASLPYIFEDFINYLKESARGLKHNNILYLFGDDFKYKNNNLFLNMDSLMSIFENHDNDIMSYEEIKRKFKTNENINIFYSTPEKYFDSIQKELSKNNNKLDIYSNIDFYPLRTDCFWTGYFTSRPYLKGYIRKGSNIFYTFSKYNSFNKLLNTEKSNQLILSNLFDLRKVVGLTQHHDSITGTCTQFVATDYIERLISGIEKTEEDFKKSIENKYNIQIGRICYNNYIVDENQCSEEFFISDYIGKKELKIGLYHPKSINSSSELLVNIEIFKSEYEYKVKGVKSDFFCINEKSIKKPELFKYKNKCFLNFFYEFKEELSFIILQKTSKINENKYIKFSEDNEEMIELIKGDKNIQRLLFSPKNFEFNLEYYNEEEKINKINFTYYDGIYYVNAGNCSDGAYIFSPYNKYPEKIKINYYQSFYFKGELGITFVTRNPMASFIIFIIFYDPFFIKVEHIFDPLDISYLLTRFSHSYAFVFKTNINNLDVDKKPIFYTDSNGLEMMKRIIDKFEYIETGLPRTGGNFYPVTSFISIQDENSNNNKNKVTIFNDRPQGGTGYLPGSIILILQKMSYTSDNRGLVERIYEYESMRFDDFKTTHFITFGTNIKKNLDYKENKYAAQKMNLINFIYNYFNTATILFKIKEIKSDKNLQEQIGKENNLINNLISKYLIISPDIRVNYELISNNLIIGEFFRYYNKYFNIERNEKEEDIFENISMNFDENTKFKIYYDKTGINYKIKEKSIIGDDIKSKLQSPSNFKLTIKRNEFIYIYFYFDN